jgi:hypothetical protein
MLFKDSVLSCAPHGNNKVIRAYDEAGNVIGTHEHIGDFREPWLRPKQKAATLGDGGVTANAIKGSSGR